MELLWLIPLYLTETLAGVLITFYAERKLAAFIQDRLGPMKVGPFGTLQPVADLLKLLQKEDIIPTKANKLVFIIAPLLIFIVVFAGFSVVPFTPSLVPSSSAVGIFFLIAIISLDVIGLVFSGWASNNKFSVIGAMRSAAQIVGYEIPIGIIILNITLWTGTLQLSTIGELQGSGQGSTLFSISGINTSEIGGILTWNLLQNPVMPFLFIIFFIASLAECNRAPFDLPEGESELVSGFHTEYSGFRFAMFFLAEYAMMFLMSVVMVFLFLGAWHSPLPNMGSFKLFEYTTGNSSNLLGQLLGAFWIFIKAVLLCVFMVIARWTYPRLRIDQLMNLCWKYLTPISLLGLIITAWLKL